MKKYILLLLISVISLNGFCQITFENGYFIDNSDRKITCLIKNVDWKNNPSEFRYKLSENDQIQSITIESVKEFGIEGRSKYQRFKVNIDRSSNAIDKMSTDRVPAFSEEQLFLKVLVEGRANLYVYEDGDLVRFFYKTDTDDIEQLVFKRYLLTGRKIGENHGYKQQLWNSFKNSEIKLKQIENITYKQKELKNLFLLYNKSQDAEITFQDEKKNKDLIHVNFRPGVKRSSLTIDNSANRFYDIDFGDEISYRVGIEAEFVLPFNKNKWSLLVEPTYQAFKSEYRKKYEITHTDRYETTQVEYKSIEIPFGFRHYFFLSEKPKIFVNFSYLIDFSFDSKVQFRYANDLEIATTDNFVLGVGFKHGKKFSLEIRQTSKRDLFKDYLYWSSNYKTTSIIFGYTIF